MNRKWYNIELTELEWYKLRPFLKERNYYFEASECFNMIHIEMLLNEAEAGYVEYFVNQYLARNEYTNL